MSRDDEAVVSSRLGGAGSMNPSALDNKLGIQTGPQEGFEALAEKLNQSPEQRTIASLERQLAEMKADRDCWQQCAEMWQWKMNNRT